MVRQVESKDCALPAFVHSKPFQFTREVSGGGYPFVMCGKSFVCLAERDGKQGIVSAEVSELCSKALGSDGPENVLTALSKSSSFVDFPSEQGCVGTFESNGTDLCVVSVGRELMVYNVDVEGTLSLESQSTISFDLRAAIFLSPSRVALLSTEGKLFHADPTKQDGLKETDFSCRSICRLDAGRLLVITSENTVGVINSSDEWTECALLNIPEGLAECKPDAICHIQDKRYAVMVSSEDGLDVGVLFMTLSNNELTCEDYSMNEIFLSNTEGEKFGILKFFSPLSLLFAGHSFSDSAAVFRSEKTLQCLLLPEGKQLTCSLIGGDASQSFLTGISAISLSHAPVKVPRNQELIDCKLVVVTCQLGGWCTFHFADLPDEWQWNEAKEEVKELEPAQAAETGLFSTPAKPAQAAETGLFGAGVVKPAESSLFSTPAKPAESGLFGSSSKPTEGGLFGKPPAAPEGGLFAKASAPAGTGLFGSFGTSGSSPFGSFGASGFGQSSFGASALQPTEAKAPGLSGTAGPGLFNPEVKAPPAATAPGLFSAEVKAPTASAPGLFSAEVKPPTASAPGLFSAEVKAPTASAPGLFSAEVKAPPAAKAPGLFSAEVKPPTASAPGLFSAEVKPPAASAPGLFSAEVKPPTASAPGLFSAEVKAPPAAKAPGLFSAEVKAPPAATAPGLFNAEVKAPPAATAPGLFNAEVKAPPAATAPGLFSAEVKPPSAAPGLFAAEVKAPPTPGLVKPAPVDSSVPKSGLQRSDISESLIEDIEKELKALESKDMKKSVPKLKITVPGSVDVKLDSHRDEVVSIRQDIRNFDAEIRALYMQEASAVPEETLRMREKCDRLNEGLDSVSARVRRAAAKSQHKHEPIPLPHSPTAPSLPIFHPLPPALRRDTPGGFGLITPIKASPVQDRSYIPSDMYRRDPVASRMPPRQAPTRTKRMSLGELLAGKVGNSPEAGRSRPATPERRAPVVAASTTSGHGAAWLLLREIDNQQKELESISRQISLMLEHPKK